MVDILYLGKFDHDLTDLPHWEYWWILGKSEIIPFYGRKSQVSQIA